MIVDLTQNKIELSQKKLGITSFVSEKEFAKHISKHQTCIVVLFEPYDSPRDDRRVFVAEKFTCWSGDSSTFIAFREGSDDYLISLNDVFSISDLNDGVFYCRSNDAWITCRWRER